MNNPIIPSRDEGHFTKKPEHSTERFYEGMKAALVKVKEENSANVPVKESAQKTTANLPLK